MKLTAICLLISVAFTATGANEVYAPYGTTMETLFEVSDFNMESVKFDPMDPERFLVSGSNGIHSVNPLTGEIDHIYNSSSSVSDVIFVNKNEFYLSHFSCIMNGTRSTVTGTFEPTLLAGDCNQAAYANGLFLESRFNLLRKIKSYGDSKLLILDRRNSKLRVADLTVGNMTETFPAPSWCGDFTDDPASKHHIYILNKHRVVHYDMRDASTRIVAGTGQEANAVGSGGEARFAYPWSVITLNKRDLIVMDGANKAIKLVQDYHSTASVVYAMCADQLEGCPSKMVNNPRMAVLGLYGVYFVDYKMLHYIPQTPSKESAMVSGSTYVRDSTACSQNLEMKPHVIVTSTKQCADHCSSVIYCTAFLHIENSCYIETSGVGLTGWVPADFNCFRKIPL